MYYRSSSLLWVYKSIPALLGAWSGLSGDSIIASLPSCGYTKVYPRYWGLALVGGGDSIIAPLPSCGYTKVYPRYWGTIEVSWVTKLIPASPGECLVFLRYSIAWVYFCIPASLEATWWIHVHGYLFRYPHYGGLFQGGSDSDTNTSYLLPLNIHLSPFISWVSF